MTQKDFLRQSYRLNEIIDSNLAELSTLRDLAENVSAQVFDREKLSGTGYVNSRIEEIVAKICGYEILVNNEIDQLIDLRQAIRNAILEVTDKDQQLLLRLRYLECLSWPEIQDRMALSKQQVHNIHGEALKVVQVPAKYQIGLDRTPEM